MVYATTGLTQEWFDSLPQFMKAADPATGDSLIRFLSLLGDQADGIRATYRRIDFIPRDEGGAVGNVSELVSATLADAAWLPWLALAVGAPSAGLTTQQRRDAISTTGGGWRGPTKAAIAAAAQTALTGTKYVRVLDHSNATGAGSIWEIAVLTIGSETPSGQAVLDAIISAGAKPAGVALYSRTFSSPWSSVESRYPTWAAWEAVTWQAIEEAGVV